MTYNPMTSARWLVLFAMLGLLLCTSAASAREFTVQQISAPKSNARAPTISDTGLVAWQVYIPREADATTGAAVMGSRSDIVVWQDGQAQNITKDHMDMTGRCQQPVASGDAIMFLAWYKSGTEGGHPFTLSTPSKTEEMLQMESAYSELFEPPKAAPSSAMEAANAEKDPAAATAPPVVAPQNPSHLQAQNRRGDGGGSSDIAVYRAGQGIERITPGTRTFCAPAIGSGGMAFQVARGWPYGYEILAIEPGKTELVQLTTNYFYALNPNIRGNELVYQGWDGNDYEIFYYRFDTDTHEQITNNQFDDLFPVVSDGNIAWIAHPTITAEIFFWSAGAIQKISEGSTENGSPSIWKDKVVWHGYDDTDLEIYYYNGRRAIKITSNTWDDSNPVIQDDLITWMSYVQNNDSEIMAFDLSDNVAIQLTDNSDEDTAPQTAGQKITWQTIGRDGPAIYLATPAAPRPAPAN